MLTGLASNPDSGRLDLAGTATPGAGPLKVWVPEPAAGGPSAAPPAVRAVAGLANFRVTAVDGGWLVRADPVGSGAYVLWLGH